MPANLQEARPLDRNALNFTARILISLSAATVLCSCASERVNEFDVRRERYLSSIGPKPGQGWGLIARMLRNEPVELSAISDDLKGIKKRKDCSDFRVAAYTRIMYLYGKDERLPEEVRQAITRTLLDFKYWIDEPGVDSMCYWSENHQVLYHSAEYLVGSLFPDDVFTNSGMTGRQHAEKGKRLAERWLSWRERFGFSEWYSNCYFEEDIWGILNLIDFAPDPEIRERAKVVMDILTLDMALNSYRGMFMCTHGRTYESKIKDAASDSTKRFSYLAWGLREFTPDMAGVSGSAVCLLTSSYRLPPAIAKIGQDTSDTFANYQWHGIHIDEAPELGISYDDMNNGMFFWGMGMYTHPKVAALTSRMWNEWDLFENRFFGGMALLKPIMSNPAMFQRTMAAREFASAGAYLDDARTYGYRTPDYFLSSVLDRRKGHINGQHLYWTAVLGPKAIVYTQYPGKLMGAGDTQSGQPSYWEGNGSAPRIAQHNNVLVAIYNAPKTFTVGEGMRYAFSHAWLPKAEFDEVVVKGNWTIARSGEGYVALHSCNPVKHVAEGKFAGRELIARGLQNCWICEMGRKSVDGEFADFVEKTVSAQVSFDNLKLRYVSPSQGEVRFGWDGPFTVRGKEVPLRRDVRFDNPYVQAERFAEKVEVKCKGESLVLDLRNHRRICK